MSNLIAERGREKTALKLLRLVRRFLFVLIMVLVVASSFLVSLPNFQLVPIAYAYPDPDVAAQWEYVESLSESSSSSTSFTEKVRLTFTPNEVGDWLIIITFQARHTDRGNSFEVRGELDDVYTICLPNQEPEINNATLEYRTFGHFRVFQDLSASEHHVDVDYRTQDSGTTMRIKNVRIVAIQIGDIEGVNNAYQEAEGGVKGTTDWTDTVEASITPTDTDKKYLVIGCLEVQPSTSKSYYAEARISVDDSTYIPVEAPAGTYWTSTTKDLGDWFPLMGHAVVTLTSGVHTIALQIKGDTTYSDYRYRRILVLRLDDVYEYEYVSNPTEDSQTGTTWKDASTLQFTSSASDYLILASMCGRLDQSGSSFQHRFTIGDVPQVDHIDHFEEQSDASYRSFQFAEIKTLLAESQTFKNQFRACDETRTAYVKESVIVAIKRPLPVDTPPVWSNAGTNNTVAGEPTLFHVKWSDDVGLSGFIFGTNNTGTWVNDTWTPMSGTADWSNVTKILNSTVGVTVQWRVWANDTSNNWSDTGILSLTTTRAVTTQLGLCFDGSGSISSSEFAIITAGIAAAVRNASQLPHDGTVELTVVQFGTGITAYARVEVAPTAVTAANFESIATTIEGISQIGGYTPTADGLLLTWLQMKGSPNFAIANRQVINVATNGFPNRALKATPPVGWPTPPGTAWGDVTYVRDNAAAEGLDEIDAEGIGVTNESLANMRDYLVYPQPGTIAPPYTPGWVKWVANATEFAAAVGEKFIIVLLQPVACFTVSNDQPNVCETVIFNATCSYDPDGWIVNYTWNFGDSNITTVTYPIITHHYDTFGNYTATLTVADNDGLTHSTSKPIWVREHPVARFTYSPSYPQVCEAVVFNASDSTADGGYIVNYTWNFGDSNITTVSDPIITHHYDNHRNYTVTLNVTDSEGKWDTESKNITVREYPQADFMWLPPSPQVGEMVTFNASISTPDGGTIISYVWDFGDSNSGTGKIANHTYATFGNFTVTLNVTDSEGKWDVVSKNITVRAHPHADFTWSPTSPRVGELVTFNGSLSTPDGGTIVSYEWDFGDNSPSVSGKIVNHTYSTNGTYTVTLNVTDSEGKWDTESKDITVTPLKYYLTVKTDPPGLSPAPTPPSNWYDNCTYVNLTAPEYANVSADTRYRFDYWDVNGTSQGANVNNITVHMDANYTATAHYVLQYLVTFNQTGLDDTANSTVVTVNGVPKNFSDLPFSDWFDNSSSITYLYSDIVSSTISRKRFSLVDVTGPDSPISVTGPVTVTGNYKAQYEVTFDQSGVGTDFTGTVVTIDGTGYDVTDLPKSFWWDKNSQHNFSFSSPLVVNASKQYVWFSTSGLSNLQSDDTFTITSSGSVVGNYSTEVKYQITFDQTGVGSDFNGTIVTIDGTPYNRTALPVSFWWDFNSTHTFAFQSPLVVTPNAKRYVWNSTSGLSSLQSGSINVSMSGSVVGNYKTQYYLTMSTNFGTVTPGSGWHDAGSTVQISASAPSVVDGERYVWLGWTGTGDDSYSGMDNPASITMNGPISETASWRHEYRLIMDTNFGTTDPSVGEHWYEAGSTVEISATAPSAISGEQYVWLGWTGTGSGSYSSMDNPASITMNGPITETAAWRHEYYLTVTSPYDSPTPTSGWFEAGTPITASVTSPWSGPTGVRYVCTGWTGTGSVPASGTATSVTFTINEPSSITWIWKTQYYLTVRTDPAGLSPAPTPPSDWYDESTDVDLTAPDPSYLDAEEYNFTHWDVDGPTVSGNPITVHMDMPHTATAHYEGALPPPPPPPAVGGEMILVKVDKPVSQPPIDLACLLLAAMGVAVLLMSRWKKGRQ